MENRRASRGTRRQRYPHLIAGSIQGPQEEGRGDPWFLLQALGRWWWWWSVQEMWGVDVMRECDRRCEEEGSSGSRLPDRRTEETRLGSYC